VTSISVGGVGEAAALFAAGDQAGYIPGDSGDDRRSSVCNASQRRALGNDRRRPAERGIGRFEVLGRYADRALIRAPARTLAENVAAAARLRAPISRGIAAEPANKGGVLAALRRSPLVPN
jgi:hypothetical protein